MSFSFYMYENPTVKGSMVISYVKTFPSCSGKQNCKNIILCNQILTYKIHYTCHCPHTFVVTFAFTFIITLDLSLSVYILIYDGSV